MKVKNPFRGVLLGKSVGITSDFVFSNSTTYPGNRGQGAGWYLHVSMVGGADVFYVGVTRPTRTQVKKMKRLLRKA